MIISKIISEKEIKQGVENGLDILKLNFVESDVIGIMNELGIDKGVVCINCSSDLPKNIKNIANLIANDDIIIGVAEISTYEYPESEWDIRPIEGKKLIPVEEVLDKISAQFIAAGFEDINDYVGYNYKRAFIYKNEESQPIIDIMHSEANKYKA